MTRRSQLPVRLSGLIPTLIVALMSLYHPPALNRLDSSVYDTLMRAAPTRAPDSRIVIVDVDEKSLAAVGQWPWRRDIIGRLIDRLREQGAGTIALDIIFAESDRYDGPGQPPDAVLAATLRAGHVVLGYALTFEGPARAGNPCVEHPIGLALIRHGDDNGESPFFTASGAVCSLPMLTEAAGASGFLNAAPDSDGLLRRAPLLAQFDDRVYPSLGLATVLAASPRPDVALQVVNVNAATLMLDGRQGTAIPLDGKSNLLLRYRGGRQTFPYASAADVLSGSAPAEMFRNKLVFVGTTALGTREVVSTPLDTLFAGVEVQATVADNLLQQDFIRRPDYAVAVETQIVLLLGLAAILLVGRLGILRGSISAAALLAIVWGTAFALMSSRGLVLSPLYPTFGLAASLFFIAITWFGLEHRRANRAVTDTATTRKLMVKSLLSLTTVRDHETGEHSRRTEIYTRILAEALADHPRFRHFLTPQNIELLASLAPLHDIGKVGVPDQVLNKPGALSEHELAEMRRHPEHGRNVIVNAQRDAGVRDDVILAMAEQVVYSHHEKWDGSGYPKGLRGDAIPIPGRLIAVVDVYDAVLTRRLYRETMSHNEAVSFIVAGKGTHFDPDVVDAFVRVSPTIQNVIT